MPTVFCGVDPGRTGAIALIDGSDLEFHDMPTFQDGKRTRIDPAIITHLMRDIRDDCEREGKALLVVIEKLQPLPPMGRRTATGEPDGTLVGHGSIASFSLGYSFGAWVFTCAALQISYQLVSPQSWKAKLLAGEPKEKDASRVAAQRFWPKQTAEPLRRKKDGGRADALWLAEYGRRYMAAASVEF